MAPLNLGVDTHTSTVFLPSDLGSLDSGFPGLFQQQYQRKNTTLLEGCDVGAAVLTPKESQKVQKHQSFENHKMILKFFQPMEPVWACKICLKISQEFHFSWVSSPPLDPSYSLTNMYKKKKHHLVWLFSKVSVLFCNKFWMQALRILFLGQGQLCFSKETAMSHPFSFSLVSVFLNLKKKIIIQTEKHKLCSSWMGKAGEFCSQVLQSSWGVSRKPQFSLCIKPTLNRA